MLHEQRVYATQKFGADKKMTNSFVLIRGESAEKREIWVGKVLLLFRCVVREGRGGDEFAFVQFMVCVPPANVVDEALGCFFAVGSCRV